MKTFKKVFALCMLTMSAFLISCSKDSGSSSSNNNNSYSMNSYGYCVRNSDGAQVDTTLCTNQNNGYYLGNNGQCMNRSGQQVAYNLCQTSNGTGQYRLNGNLCYDSYTGQQVNYQLCANSNTGMNNGYAQYCNGMFYYQGQEVYCYGANCAGYTLISAQTGQAVRCQ